MIKRYMVKNYYQVLGVKRSASQEEIKKAYRALAKKYHPDVNENKDETKKLFQEITIAYKVLSNPEERKKYNAWGHETYVKSAFRSNQGSYYHENEYTGWGHSHEEGHCGGCGGHSHEEGHCGGCGGHSHEDGHCGACAEHRHGHADDREPAPHFIRTSVRLTYREVLTGAEKTAEIYEQRPCGYCKGKGVKIDSRNGDEKCTYCGGKGHVKKRRQVRVKIPPRCYEGKFFMLDDVLCEGEIVEQKNIVVKILLEEQKEYIRTEYHLYSVKKVSFVDMVLGGTIDIPTLEGTTSYTLKPGTRNGFRVRLIGMGLWMPPKIGQRGDLYVTLEVEIPTSLTNAQEKALRSFADTMKGSNA